jgi:hypothetical protein
MSDIEAPINMFPSQSLGPSGEQIYWAPVGSIYPVCPDTLDSQKVNEVFNKAALAWANLVVPVDIELLDAANEDEKALEILKQEAFGDGLPFLSISSKPLNENYFEDNYFICYFTSKPYRMNKNTYFTVGVIGP